VEAGAGLLGQLLRQQQVMSLAAVQAGAGVEAGAGQLAANVSGPQTALQMLVQQHRAAGLMLMMNHWLPRSRPKVQQQQQWQQDRAVQRHQQQQQQVQGLCMQRGQQMV
jgi:hypothetical protein